MKEPREVVGAPSRRRGIIRRWTAVVQEGGGGACCRWRSKRRWRCAVPIFDPRSADGVLRHHRHRGRVART